MTILQWYEMLPKRLRDKAQAYACDQQNSLIQRDSIVSDLRHSICLGFSWSITEEGWNYWEEVYLKSFTYQRRYEQKHNLKL